MAEAILADDGTSVQFLAAATYAANEVIQMADGRAGVVAAAVSSGSVGTAYVSGRFAVVKSSGVVILDGGRVYWDYSANGATFREVGDRDFYIGRAIGDQASTATMMNVALNIDPPYDIDILRDPYVTSPTGTQALGGFLPPQRTGGALRFVLSATSEAQKLDALSKHGFATGANAIVEFAFAVTSDGAGTVVDVNIGVANATHATDADSITEHCFMHLDANNTNINFQSKDSGTTVAATDSTTDYTESQTSRTEVWMDLRDLTNIGLYVNGAAVLTGTTFKLNAASGPLKLLAHIEKSSSTDTYDFDLEWLRARFGE